MTTFALSQTDLPNSENTVVQEYVRALLARQQAMDVLESIQFQINQVWSGVRRLLDNTSSAVRAAKKAEAKNRAARAAEAQESFRELERRREDCIAALHQAERRANSALCRMILHRAAKGVPAPLRRAGRKLKRAVAAAC